MVHKQVSENDKTLEKTVREKSFRQNRRFVFRGNDRFAGNDRCVSRELKVFNDLSK